jgi:putative ABC transport system permease protein
MNVFRLAFAYARRRPLGAALNVVLLALGVATITLVILLSHELEQRLVREAAGIDLVVGAKGSPLQLVLAGIYHADVPPGNVPLAAVEELARRPHVRQVIPLALGDSFRGFRIVGTEPAFVAHYGATLAQGRAWAAPMEAVLGAEAARATGLAVGATFAGSHGLAESGGDHDETPYRVAGVLAPTGRVIDRLVLTGIDSVWKVHAHADADADHARDADAEPAKAAPAASPSGAAPAGEVTLALVKYASPVAAASLPRAINAQTVLQAASPAYESARLFTVFGIGTDVVRGFALLLVVASAFGLFVALTQALDERRYDLAIMRALGASRARIVAVLAIESALLAMSGLLAGLGIAHLLAATIGTWLPAAGALAHGARAWQAEEWGVVALALGAGIIATLIPAWRAYRQDVAATLADG